MGHTHEALWNFFADSRQSFGFKKLLNFTPETELSLELAQVTVRVAGKELVRKAVHGKPESSHGGFQQKIGTGDLLNEWR